MRSPNLASDSARRAVIEPPSKLGEELRFIPINHNVINGNSEIALLVQALVDSRLCAVAAPRGSIKETEHRVDCKQSLSLSLHIFQYGGKQG